MDRWSRITPPKCLLNSKTQTLCLTGNGATYEVLVSGGEHRLGRWPMTATDLGRGRGSADRAADGFGTRTPMLIARCVLSNGSQYCSVRASMSSLRRASPGDADRTGSGMTGSAGGVALLSNTDATSGQADTIDGSLGMATDRNGCYTCRSIRHPVTITRTRPYHLWLCREAPAAALGSEIEGPCG